MHESDIAGYARRSQKAPSGEFTTQIFGRIGLDRYAAAASALGPVYVAWSVRGVSGLRVASDEADFEAWYAERFGRRAIRAFEDDATMQSVRAALGGGHDSVPLDLSGCSPFERAVLGKAAEIARGNARPYGWIAREMGAPGAVRAVGSALGRNPVPLLVPCHRVIRADQSVGEYVFGGEAKRHLLETEGLDLRAVERFTRRGFRYVGCNDGTFCMPTCGDVATRLDTEGYVGLRSVQDAHEHGLVACAHCRPVAA